MTCSRPFSTLLVSAILLAEASYLAGAQSVIFSKPPDDPTKKANSFMDQQPSHDASAGKMPAPLFNGSQNPADFGPVAPMPRPQPLTPQQIQDWQKKQNEQRNWGLMTPAEMFGVPTVEKILGLPVPESEKNLTQEDRFLRRRQQARNEAATNSLRVAGGASDDNNNPFQTAADRDKRKQVENANQARRTGVFQSPFSEATSLEQAEAEQRKNSVWQGVFSPPPAQPREDPVQVAEMERFRALLESQPEGQTPQATPMAASFQSPAGRTAVPEYKAPTAYVPAANFEAQRQQEIGKPMGIATLPPISAQPKKKDDSKPLVKTPPWMSSQPQPNTPPAYNPF